jgi:hypothetical protein
VIAFDGPGQGTALEEGGMALTAERQWPVSAALDYFRLEPVTLSGLSLGGCLAVRAEAGEPRVTRVVADDVLTDLLNCNLRQLPPYPAGLRRCFFGCGLTGRWTPGSGIGCGATCSPTGASGRASRCWVSRSRMLK